LPADAAVARARNEPLRGRVGEELADGLIYLVQLADVLQIDLGDAALRKLHGSTSRFPAEKVRGQAPEKV
jgi:dCTP diphosphatase